MSRRKSSPLRSVTEFAASARTTAQSVADDLRATKKQLADLTAYVGNLAQGFNFMAPNIVAAQHFLDATIDHLDIRQPVEAAVQAMVDAEAEKADAATRAAEAEIEARQAAERAGETLASEVTTEGNA
jgi:1-deoxy-D-xylulose 5-phosphate reductoisomerase